MQTSVQGGVFAMTEPCTECKGRGLVVDQPCETCHGFGRGTSSKTMQVRIPAGVQDGQRIRLKGKGAAGERGGPRETSTSPCTSSRTRSSGGRAST